MNKFFKIAFVAAAAFVSTNVMAQTVETFSFGKVAEWSLGTELDGSQLVRKSSNLTMTFLKGEGEQSPVVKTSSRAGKSDVTAALFVGNTLKIESENNSITSVKFGFSQGSCAARIEPTTNEPNYSISEGTYDNYVWTGKTSSFFLKNVSNDKGIEMLRVEVTWVEGATGVEHVTTVDLQNAAKVYDLNGTFVGNGVNSVKTSGVYVVGGKKTVVRK